jgi:hypothetical protein
MNDPARHYRCDVRDFVCDLMNFIKEQIGRAVDDPLDQFAATVAASGVLPVMRERLVPENEALWATLVLLLVPYLVGTDGGALASLGKMSREEFVPKPHNYWSVSSSLRTTCLLDLTIDPLAQLAGAEPG